MNSKEITDLLNTLEKATQTGIALYQDVKEKILQLMAYVEQTESKQNINTLEKDKYFQDVLDKFKKILTEFDKDAEKNKKYDELNEILATVVKTFESPDNASQINTDLLERKNTLVNNCNDFFDEVLKQYQIYNMLKYDYERGKPSKSQQNEEEKVILPTQSSSIHTDIASNKFKFFGALHNLRIMKIFKKNPNTTPPLQRKFS